MTKKIGHTRMIRDNDAQCNDARVHAGARAFIANDHNMQSPTGLVVVVCGESARTRVYTSIVGRRIVIAYLLCVPDLLRYHLP